MDHPYMSGLLYPSQHLGPNVDIEEIIASQNIISRVMHSYFGILVPIGFLAGIVSVVTITWNKVKHQTMGHLDFYLLNLSITDLTIILYSFTAITRPDYMNITNLSCGVLASFFNLSYFYSQILLLLMLLLLVFVNESNTNSLVAKATQHRKVCACIMLLISLILSNLIVSQLGTYKDLNSTIHCQLDPLNAKPEYDFVKFSLGFCLPSFLILILFVMLLVRLVTGVSGVKERVKEQVVVLFNISVVFAVRLFYNIMLIRRTQLKLQGVYLHPREELILNIAELVLFSGSCLGLMSIPTLYKPCRIQVWGALQFIKKKCVGTQTSTSVEM
ncbi:C-C chemokine receptor type 5-like [Pelobates fuscus]|uniref:C-C chemokine receptor type 5-like n=1 Tax=Pelobates fuscus TaxID=191477 RepID=UPI002FE46590